jgi:hypothetical protein
MIRVMPGEKMNKKNLIHIADLDQEVFRIFPLHRIEELFLNNMLVLMRPWMWKDPFENFLLKCSVVDQDGSIVSLDNLAKEWNCLCWTLNADSDAMWRIYSHDKKGIRVKTTIRKLAEAIWDPKNRFSSLKYFIGKVQYYPNSGNRRLFEPYFLLVYVYRRQNTGFAETLLIKRTEFEHEKEIRILANSNDATPDPRANGDLYSIPIDPNLFIDELCIDPRLDVAEVDMIQIKLRGIGYKGPIIQ